jgi:hypothetical protein
MTDVILDLETYSTRSDAVILSIGAIKFTRGPTQAPLVQRGCHLPPLSEMDTFYRRITIESCNGLGLHTDPSTVKWWATQNKAMREECVEHKDRVSIQEALADFSDWFGNSRCVWGNGSSFDVTIIETAYNRCKIQAPWKFWNIRDVRTVFDLGGVKSWDLPQENLHHPVDDCYRELIGMDIALKRLVRVNCQ